LWQFLLAISIGNARAGPALAGPQTGAAVVGAQGHSRSIARRPKGYNRAYIHGRLPPFVIPHIKFDVLLKPAGGGYR